jgi:hypothetical protein
MVKARTGKGIFERYNHVISDFTGETETGVALGSYQDLLKKLSAITDMTELEIFKTACYEKGFGWSEHNIERHYDLYTKTGEIPNYVEAFLDDGKESILRRF